MRAGVLTGTWLMRTWLTGIWLLAVVAGYGGCGVAGMSRAAAEPQSLGGTLEPVRQHYGLPALAAAVVKNGDIVAAGAVGVRALGTTIPVTLDDRFHLGSDTKAMTATLAGMMVEEGKLRWDSTLGEVLGADVPGLNAKLAAVTLTQLLSHSSGIPSDTDETLALYFNLDAFQYNLSTLRLRLLAAWKNHEPKIPEGSPFQYANLGYIFAGAMIEKAAAMPWEELITERIFAPLGLATAGLGAQATMGKIDAPVGHQFGDDGKITPIFWGDAADAPAVIGPAGNAHMSILDFARWAGWNAGEGRRGPALVKPETLRFIHAPKVATPPFKNPKPGTPTTGEYAFGWGVVKFDWTGHPVLQHNGSNSMNLAKIMIDVDNDLGVVVTTNFPEQKADEAASEVAEALYRQFVPH
jgi:CubicO group peptidase (beta-lactamase class C family)